jgi:threonine aldolase
MPRGFASDNNSGVHPDILNYIISVNEGHTIGYGDDKYTRDALARLKEIFGDDSEIFFVFTGAASNVLSIDALSRTYNAVICSETAHIYVDECGAPERFTSCKLLPVKTPDGKLTIEGIRGHMHGIGFEHHVQPKIISISQSTEMGTVYTFEEIKAICDFAHENEMYVHMDGARLSNAAAFLDSGFRRITRDAGVDVLSFGGTKNGMMFGEAIVFFNPHLAKDFKYIRKQSMQLASKMRFISAQFIAFLEKNLWLKNALHANRMARMLYSEVIQIPGVKVTQKVQSNGVFAIIPPSIIPILQEEFFFYVWCEESSEVRWMTSFDTTEEDIKKFADSLRRLMLPFAT